MKRGTPRHPKVIALAEQLGIEVFAAAGLLELLWHFTAEFSPAGDIGRHSNAAIAKALFWRGKPDKLIFGLVAAKWVDLTEPDRLVVHDWPQHADDTTHNKLARAKRLFSDGTTPSLKRLPPKDRASAEEFYATPSEEKRAHAERTECAREAHSGLGLAKAKASVEVKKEINREGFESWRIDENFVHLREAYFATGAPSTDSDWEKAWRFEWKRLDFQQKTDAIAYLPRCDPAFLKYPQNYLKDREWTRPERPAPKSKIETLMDSI